MQESELEYLIELPAKVKAHIQRTADPDDRVDLLGQVNSCATALGRVKRWGQAEVNDGEGGGRWVAKVGNVGERSYSMRLLTTLGEGDTDTRDTIRKLVEAEVVTVKWNWSKLEQYAARHGVTLTIAGKEITPDDAEHDVGLVWTKSNPSYDPVEP